MCEAHNHAATDTATEAAAAETSAAETTAHDHSAHDHGTDGGAHHHDVAAVESETAECLVMRGNYVNKADAEAAGLVREHEGTKYYLCCAACGPLFDAAPEKYAAAAA
ncbi:YHS domain-containing protein [Agrococcus jenensis]|uniref:YHS domain-containing protein n=1 Tax=Agrococcus jenensis TaxID=46353 RepID=A0A3N2AS20_9MICO|nr:YHS domain-containing protein [Agrococcus jenensis]ROR65839.1 YHS domain-containing protein [Agrococcus jenensis]